MPNDAQTTSENGVLEEMLDRLDSDEANSTQTPESDKAESYSTIAPLHSSVSSELVMGLAAPRSPSAAPMQTPLNSTTPSVTLNFTRLLAYHSRTVFESCLQPYIDNVSARTEATQDELQLLWDSLLLASPSFDFLNKVSWCGIHM